MKKQVFGEYYLGFDLGTNSAGWAVTDKSYNLLRFNKNDMWGSRIFEEAKTSADRRTYKATKRRLSRRRNRLKLLEKLFNDEIYKEDETFFIRLEESNLHAEDRSVDFKFPLFIKKYPLWDGNEYIQYTDENFHEDYPTIYHLRRDLIKEDRKFDIRLLFLAIHHIVKYRGHFIFEGQKFENITDFTEAYEDLRDIVKYTLELEIEDGIKDKLESVICSNKSKTDKKADIKELIKDKNLQNVLFAAIGSSVKFKDIFGNEKYTGGINLSEIEDYNEKKEEYYEELGDKVELLDNINKIYSYMILNKILGGEKYISFNKSNVYENHKKELEDLKYIYKKYLDKNKYYKFFRKEKFTSQEVIKNENNNYCSYIGSASKKINIVDLNKYIKKDLDKIKSFDSEKDEELYNSIVEKLGEYTYLEKPKGSMNSTIPYQVHEFELEKILENQSKYHDFLSIKEDGITIKDKILKLFKFRIPYYVGPLNTDKNVIGENTWVVRKDEDNKSKITPWNFEDKVDLAKSAEKFIKRMTNKCSYLSSENVLPKKSLLYSEYTVLDELNGIRIDGKKLNIKLKNEIYEDLFKNNKRVTKRKLAKYLESKQVEFDVITGIDNEFNSKLDSYVTFKNILGDKIEKLNVQDFVEKCIEYKCLYGNDKKLFKNSLKSEYKKYNISDEEFNKINKLNFKEWGRLSKKLLLGIKFEDLDTGEQFENLIYALKNTNNTRMYFMSSSYNLNEKIKEENGNIENEEFNIYNFVEDLYISPSVRRTIIQTYHLAMEIKSITNKQPKRIFVETSRGIVKNDIKSKRKNQILDLYNVLKKDKEYKLIIDSLTSELNNFDDNRLRQEKLFLYFMQLGKSMYTGKKIDLDNLLNSNIWDIDHIIPQSIKKDDSFSNKVLVEKKENHDKSNNLVSFDIQKKMKLEWTNLLKNKLISKEKYNRLTRTVPFTENELIGFIERQLVTTMQSTKEVIKMFNIIFPESEVIYSKSSLVSYFRNEFDILKVRELNDTHHAQDAYLNIVVGNVHYVKYTKDYRNYIKNESNLNTNKDKNSDNFKNIYKYNIKRQNDIAWEKDITIKVVKSMCNKKTAIITKMLIESKGELFNINLLGKLEKGNEPYIIPNVPKALKGKGMDEYELAEKYGYYNSLKPAYFVLFKYKNNKSEDYTLNIERICLTEKARVNSKNEMEEFLEQKGYKDAKFIRKILKYQKIVIDGYPYIITGLDNKNNIELKNFRKLFLDRENMIYCKNALKFYEKNINIKNEKDYIVNFKKISKINEANETLEEAKLRLNEEFNKLFISICDKSKSKAYVNFINVNILHKLYDKEEEFNKLNLFDKSDILVKMLSLLSKNSMCNFKKIKITNDGRIRKKLSTLIKNHNNIYIVDESVTGLFEKRMRIK